MAYDFDITLIATAERVRLSRRNPDANLGCRDPYGEAFFTTSVTDVDGEHVQITRR